MTTDPRKLLCGALRGARVGRALSLADIGRITRIPEKSLQHLEEGRFEELPADVFVRGFLRAYARCVGLDVEETLARYTACGLPPPPVASDLAQTGRTSARTPLRPRPRPATSPPGVPTQPPLPAVPVLLRPNQGLVVAQGEPTAASSQSAAQRHPDEGSAPLFGSPSPASPSEAGSRRGAVTLAVIILVIVATLTMSYLLRRPSEHGDGVTRAEPTPSALLLARGPSAEPAAVALQ